MIMHIMLYVTVYETLNVVHTRKIKFVIEEFTVNYALFSFNVYFVICF